jgi:hypothetical protein
VELKWLKWDVLLWLPYGLSNNGIVSKTTKAYDRRQMAWPRRRREMRANETQDNTEMSAYYLSVINDAFFKRCKVLQFHFLWYIAWSTYANLPFSWYWRQTTAADVLQTRYRAWKHYFSHLYLSDTWVTPLFGCSNYTLPWKHPDRPKWLLKKSRMERVKWDGAVIANCYWLRAYLS